MTRYYYCYCIAFDDGTYYYGSRTSKCEPKLDVKYNGSPSKTIAAKWLTNSYTKTVLSVHDTPAQARAAERVLIRKGWLAGNTINVAVTEWRAGRIRVIDRFGQVVNR